MAHFSTFVILPMSFLCGTFFQVSKFPRLVADLIMALPLTHAAISLRALAQGAGFPLVSLIVLMSYAAVLFGLGVYVTYRVE